MTDQSLTSQWSDRSLRPAVFGTLTAADVSARGGSFQLPGRSPATGIINFSSNGIFNLPRYYPTTYQRFDDDGGGGGGGGGSTSTWRSGEHKRTIPFYRDQPVDDDDRSEPVYSRPNKTSRIRDSAVRLPREQFTIALGSETDSQRSVTRRRRRYRDCCCCCRYACCQRCTHTNRPTSWLCCPCLTDRASTAERRGCLSTIFVLYVLTFIAVAVFLAIFLLVTKPGQHCLFTFTHSSPESEKRSSLFATNFRQILTDFQNSFTV